MLEENFAYTHVLELIYKDIVPCIIIEKYIGEIADSPNDYKFICFNGEVKYVWCDMGRFSHHTRNLYNCEYQKVNFTIGNFPPCSTDTKPENFTEMLQIAKTLCRNFVCVRIDLYNCNGSIYFGEITFSSGSGMELPNPIGYDAMLGEMLKIDLSARNRITLYR